MIKKFLLAIFVALPMLAVAQAPKFGVVNTQVIIEAMPEVKAAQEKITESSKKYEDEFKKLQEEMEKKFGEYQALAADTPESIKERRMQEIQELDQKMQQFRATVSQDLSRQQETLMAPIQEKVRQAINTVGKENSMTFIFENILPVYTGTDVQDVTAKVKAKLGLQ
ncbi:MAG TPA: OmpH family outer membrane protein [Muribaculum sp.]|jgi:outer membrane protein|uniref:OmpH family outer membrane protein n=1 Tax=Heminiphilus faecis TaxID=2601703 RepID=A0ABV4CUT1_9BACT|nr:OmpH family outer membrane protein [Heminiphilus faecis]RLT77320.1 OmpH family outer membrane protein [bacterium J10(2018)]HRF68259.1 OmpH family outer membrane protein [Muribaculum sp.]